MTVNPSTMQEKRPAVHIMTCEPPPREAIEPILWGLEEEGIPAVLHEVSHAPAAMLAKQGADMSPLNVGIGINAAEETVSLHHRDLPKDKPLFTFAMRDLQALHLRTLGVNAARLVKGNPLVLREESPVSTKDNTPARALHKDSDELLEVIVRVVLELLANK